MKNKYTKDELFKGMTPHTAHADLISSTHHNWDEFFDSSETVSDDYMVEIEQLVSLLSSVTS